MTTAIAIPFDSGIVLCADTSFSGCPSIFERQYGSSPRYARSIFVIGDPATSNIPVVQRCEQAIDLLRPVECTIDRMRATIEHALRKAYQERFDSELQSNPTASLLIALYSSVDERYSLFHAVGITLRERVGYDCQGSAAHVARLLLRHRYEAAESMGLLDLTTVSSIATETMQLVRGYTWDISDTIEIFIMFANGLASGIRYIHQDGPKSGLPDDLSAA